MGRAVVNNQSDLPVLRCKFLVKFFYPFGKQIPIHQVLFLRTITIFMHIVHYRHNKEFGVFTFKQRTILTTETLVDIFLHTLLHEDELYNVKLPLISRACFLYKSTT